MDRRRLRLLVPLLAAAAAVALLASPALGQAELKGKQGEISDARCYGHHREEGFRSMDLFPVTVTSVAKGEQFEFELTVRNPWLHEIRDLYGFVNISGIPGATFLGAKDPVRLTESGTLGAGSVGPLPVGTVPVAPRSTAAHDFMVEDNATEIHAVLTGAPGATGGNVWALQITAPSGESWVTTTRSFDQDFEGGAANVATLKLSYANVTTGGTGGWSATAIYARGAEPQADYTLDLTTYYNLSRATELRVKGPPLLEKRESATLRFTVVAPPDALAEGRLVFGGIAHAYHEHTDPNAEDDGVYLKWSSLSFPVADQTVIAGQGAVPVLVLDPGPIMKSWGQVLGFAGSFLLLPALFLGGTFGTGSVRAFNSLLGSPRRRVLWHNASSYLLLVVSLLHMFLFLFEHFWNWEVGLIWGGLSLAAMIGLAVTGAFQRRFVAKWGFERWRFTHFSLGTIVVGFVLVHMLADGTHLAFAREWLGTSPAGET